VLLAAPYTGQELYLVQRDPTGKSRKGLRLIVGYSCNRASQTKPIASRRSIRSGDSSALLLRCLLIHFSDRSRSASVADWG
jgi:hypothetical protein